MKNTHEKHLLYYQKEMSFLRRMGGLFAAKYPKIAKRLNFNEHQSNDPHVERLIESFAYLTSYLQKDIDDQFPRVSSALLKTLYPHQATLTPPMSIAHFDAYTKGGSTDVYKIPKHTKVFSESATGDRCRFQTCTPVDLWPINVSDVQLTKLSKYDFATNLVPSYAYGLKISLRSEKPLGSLSPKNLRFYINAPKTDANTLYHLLFEEDAPVIVLGDSDQETPILLPKGSIKPVGFDRSEAVIPSPKNGHRAYALLQEYFSFPKKFMFFDIENLRFDETSKTVDILIPILHGTVAKNLVINKRTFLLGCAPIINLFSKTSEPIRLNHRKIEYRLIADHRRESTTEIHSVDRIFTSGTSDVDVKEIAPYFSYNHHDLNSRKNAFWHARQIPSANPKISGTDTMVSFVDMDMSPAQTAVDVAYARIWCTNRDLARQLSAGTLLQAEELNPPVKDITCLEQPTETLYPADDGATQWKLVSQLSANYLSFSSDKESLDALKEVLSLYAGDMQGGQELEINSLKDMHCETVLRRITQEGWRGFVKGTSVTLTIDDNGSPAFGSLLFMSVLAHFFGLYSHINSFAELSVKTTNKEGVWKQWPPINGTQKLL
jgi:type VI secretion system protein ImpG